jgi:anaerobic nitric oxide reductase transcription regulator
MPAVTAAEIPRVEGAVGDLRLHLDDYQRQLIGACLERHQGNWASAARELGLDRANLSRLAKRLNIKA